MAEQVFPTKGNLIKAKRSLQQAKQGFDENRSMDETLDLAWDLLSLLPASELDRVSEQLIKEHYHPENAKRFV